MRNLLIAIALLFSSTASAEPTWQAKPVQCATIEEIYAAYIFTNNLKPLFIGVATVRNHQEEVVPIPVALYLNDVGQWLWVEINGEKSCVVSMGDGFDPSQTHESLIELIFGRNNT